MSELHYNKSGRRTEAAAEALTFAHISYFLRHFNIKSMRNSTQIRQKEVKKVEKEQDNPCLHTQSNYNMDN